MRKKVVRIFILLFFFNALGISYAQSSETNKLDSIFCFINNDTIVDYITVNEIVDPIYTSAITSVMLDIYVSLDSLTHKRYSKKIDLKEASFLHAEAESVSIKCKENRFEISYKEQLGNEYHTTYHIFKKIKENYYFHKAYNFFENRQGFIIHGGIIQDSMNFEQYTGNEKNVIFREIVSFSGYQEEKEPIINDYYNLVKTSFITRECEYTLYTDPIVLTYVLENISIIKGNLNSYNDIAYYLEQSGQYSESVFLLERILEKFPNRVVAYINLGDAYWGVEKQKQAKEAYEKYIELMKSQEKDLNRIPQRVYERIKKESTEEF